MSHCDSVDFNADARRLMNIAGVACGGCWFGWWIARCSGQPQVRNTQRMLVHVCTPGYINMLRHTLGFRVQSAVDSVSCCVISVIGAVVVMVGGVPVAIRVYL